MSRTLGPKRWKYSITQSDSLDVECWYICHWVTISVDISAVCMFLFSESPSLHPALHPITQNKKMQTSQSFSPHSGTIISAARPLLELTQCCCARLRNRYGLYNYRKHKMYTNQVRTLQTNAQIQMWEMHKHTEISSPPRWGENEWPLAEETREDKVRKKLTERDISWVEKNSGGCRVKEEESKNDILRGGEVKVSCDL